jgi:alginate O-acetyltransferase complex protein AlgI
MLFNSLTFVVFFAAVLLAYRVLGNWNAKKAMLLVASYVFYGAWNPPFVALLAISTLVDWFVAKHMALEEDVHIRRRLLVISLLVNLGFLGFFKYGGFLLENFVALMASFGVDYKPAAPSIVLPVGISFYTFQTLSYTLDIYRRRLKPARSFLDFALFVSFFPQLVAGPIVRAADFLPQCVDERRTEARAFGWGLFLMTLGLFEKVVLADGLLAGTADSVFGSPGPASALDTWLGSVAFAGQIFCDFAGYSTCAIGAALCLGFHLPTNFRFPYGAVGFRDFWRRWHISLSTWLRDYLYIPLGGSRNGRWRTLIALMLTMLLGGFLHGLFLVEIRHLGLLARLVPRGRTLLEPALR